MMRRGNYVLLLWLQCFVGTTIPQTIIGNFFVVPQKNKRLTLIEILEHIPVDSSQICIQMLFRSRGNYKHWTAGLIFTG